MATSSRADIDEIIRMVANSLVDEADIEAVGKHFGFKYQHVQLYLKGNSRGTSDGTVKMLHDGLKKTRGNAISILTDALNRAGLVRLADDLKQDYIDSSAGEKNSQKAKEQAISGDASDHISAGQGRSSQGGI